MSYVVSRTLVRTVSRWARTAHESAVSNARGAATECSRRRVERAEVEAYLSRLAGAVTAVTEPEAPAAAVVGVH